MGDEATDGDPRLTPELMACVAGQGADAAERMAFFAAAVGIDLPKGAAPRLADTAALSPAAAGPEGAATDLFAAQEIMAYFGARSAAEVAGMMPMIRARAAARVNARTARHGAGTFTGKLEIMEARIAYAKFFTLQDFRVRFERYDGSTSAPVDRAVFIGTDAAIVLPYDPRRDRVLLIEQVRMGPMARHDPYPWQLEPIAGRVDANETPQDTARREALEEAGLTLTRLEPVAESYASPGASSEFYYVYVAPVDLPDGITQTGGLDSEEENIRSHLMPFDAFLEMLEQMRAPNAPLVMAGYWLAHHRTRLRAAAASG